MLYKLQMQGFTGSLQWEYNFESASDLMATEYAHRRVQEDPAARAGCLRVYLFNMDQDTCIGDFVFDKPTVRNRAEQTNLIKEIRR